MKRKMIMAAVMLTLLLAGCGEDPKTQALKEAGQETAAVADTERESTQKTEPTADDIVRTGKEDAPLKVAMVADIAGVDDKSFNQSAWEGLIQLTKDVNARSSYIKANASEDYEKCFDLLVEDGNEMCWGVGYNFGDAIESAAAKYPDVRFGILDRSLDTVPENVTCVTFRMNEASFLVGYIAASVTETNVIGFIGGEDVDVVQEFLSGYKQGAEYYANKNGKQIEIKNSYVGSFVDPERAKKTAALMFEGNCDVVFHAAGAAGIGVIEEAAAEGKYVIGVDSDQSYLAPDVVLTSAMKRVDIAMENLCVQYSIGDNIGGKSLEFGLKEHAVGIPKEHPNFSDELYEKVMEIEQDICDGTIVVQ